MRLQCYRRPPDLRLILTILFPALTQGHINHFILNHFNVFMKKILLTLALAIGASSFTFAQDPVVSITPSTSNMGATNQYNTSITVSGDNGNTWTAKGFSNNNNATNWESHPMRCGNKSNTPGAYVATFSTDFAIAASIDKIEFDVYTIKRGTSDKINNITLYVSDNETFDNADSYVVAENADLPSSASQSKTLEFAITSPKANQYYRLSIDLQKANNNGWLALDAVRYYGQTGDEDPNAVAKPVISCSNNVVSMSCATEGASIYYTLNGTTPSDASTLYDAPFAITETVTVNAIAYNGENVSEVATKECTYEKAIESFAEFFESGKASGTINGTITVYANSGKYLYAKDSKGGNGLLYNETTSYVNGDQFDGVTGTAYTYGQNKQLQSYTLGAKLETTAPVEPTAATVATLAEMPLFELVSLKNVTISGVSSKNFTLNQDGATFAGYNQFTISLPTDLTVEYDMTGIRSSFNGNDQFQPLEITASPVIVQPEAVVCDREIIDETLAVTTLDKVTFTSEKAEYLMFSLDGGDTFEKVANPYTTTFAEDAMVAVYGQAGELVSETLMFMVEVSQPAAPEQVETAAEIVDGVMSLDRGTAVDFASANAKAINLYIGEEAAVVKEAAFEYTFTKADNGKTFRLVPVDALDNELPELALEFTVAITPAAEIGEFIADPVDGTEVKKGQVITVLAENAVRYEWTVGETSGSSAEEILEYTVDQVSDFTLEVTAYNDDDVAATASFSYTIAPAEHYRLVTSQDEIVDGGKYIIVSEVVASSTFYALGAFDTKHYNGIEITVENGLFINTDGIAAVELQYAGEAENDNIYSIKVGEKYISFTGTSNQNMVEADAAASDKEKFTITFEEGKLFITSKGYSARGLRFNPSTTPKYFSNYGEDKQNAVSLYRLVEYPEVMYLHGHIEAAGYSVYDLANPIEGKKVGNGVYEFPAFTVIQGFHSNNEYTVGHIEFTDRKLDAAAVTYAPMRAEAESKILHNRADVDWSALEAQGATHYGSATADANLGDANQALTLKASKGDFANANTFIVGADSKISNLKLDLASQTMAVEGEDLTTGVAEITVSDSDASAEYYNLQGIRVENPTTGLYIRRTSEGSSKVFIR